jgi:hypothetical protein
MESSGPGLTRPSIFFAKKWPEKERWTTRNRVYPISGALARKSGKPDLPGQGRGRHAFAGDDDSKVNPKPRQYR